jgi:hypothetical protein
MALFRVSSADPTVLEPVTTAKYYRGSFAKSIAVLASNGRLEPELTPNLGTGATVEVIPGLGSFLNGFLVGTPFIAPIVEPELRDALLLMDP